MAKNLSLFAQRMSDLAFGVCVVVLDLFISRGKYLSISLMGVFSSTHYYQSCIDLPLLLYLSYRLVGRLAFNV